MPVPNTLTRISMKGAAACAVAALLLSSPLQAQYRVLSVNGPSHSVTINPFFLLAGWISGDYEQRVNSSLSAGGGASYFEYGDTHYTSVVGRATLYPEDHAMHGFGFSGTFGITHVSHVPSYQSSVYDVVMPTYNYDATKRATYTSPSFGVEASYQWMLGRTRRTALVIGLGGTRLLTSKSTLDGTDRVFVTSRLGLGYAW
jgi:hypothetical protein